MSLSIIPGHDHPITSKNQQIITANGQPGSFNSDPVGDEWPMFRGALNHTGTVVTVPVQGSKPLWNHAIMGYSTAAVVGGRVYLGSGDHNVYCLNATTGAHAWNYTTDGCVFSTPAIAGGRVYVGSSGNKVYCLNAITGAFIWSYTTGGMVWSSPAIASGRVYVGIWGDPNFYCLNASTGTSVWNYTTGGAICSSPAVAGGRVYVGSCSNKVYCLNATTGASVWNYTCSGVYSSPAVAGGRVYVGSCDKNIYCLNMTTGARIWNYTTGSVVLSSPTVAGGRVYVGGSRDCNVYCLNATTGTRVWNYITGSSLFGVMSSPAVAAGNVYVGGPDNKTYCLNANTGAFIWSYYMGNSSEYHLDSSPTITGGRVYVEGNETYCLPMIFSTTVPSPPRAAQASGGIGQLVISWTKPADNGGSPITGYKIYRGLTAGAELLYTTIGNNTTWTDTAVANGQIYYYQVAAVNAIGAGANSTEVNAMPAAPPRNTVFSVVLKLHGQVFRNPIHLTINITYGDWPVQQAWCVVDNSTVHVLALSNGTATWGIYVVDVNLTAGSHALAFFVKDTGNHTISQSVTITVIVATPASTNSTTIVIIIVIILGISVSVAVPLSYSRFRQRLLHRKPIKSKTSAQPKSMAGAADRKSLESDKRTRLLNISMPAASAGQPFLGVNVAQRCIVHKGLIVGPSLKCKHCGAIYCQDCAYQLIQIDEHCFSYGDLLDVVSSIDENRRDMDTGE